MFNLLNFPTAEQIDIQNALLASIASNMGEGGIDIKNWRDVQRFVRMGLHKKILTVGDKFLTPFDDNQHVVNVIGINHDKPSDPRFTNSLTLQFEDCLMNAQFSNYQALYHAKEVLPAGKHVFTQDDTQERWEIETTQPVPEGGQIFIPSWNSDPYYPLKATTYEADRKTIIEDNITVVGTTDEDTLGEVNVRHRIMYGSNNYKESAIKQWLNSDSNNWAWESQTDYDRPSSYKTKGFLQYLDPELVEVLGAVDKQVARNTVTDEGGQDTFSDKIFLLSRVEVFGGSETDAVETGENPYPYYSALAAKATTGEIPGRIKLLSGSSRYWWLRSPYVSTSNRVRYVSTSGAVSNGSAYYADGLSPACVII